MCVFFVCVCVQEQPLKILFHLGMMHKADKNLMTSELLRDKIIDNMDQNIKDLYFQNKKCQ